MSTASPGVVTSEMMMRSTHSAARAMSRPRPHLAARAGLLEVGVPEARHARQDLAQPAADDSRKGFRLGLLQLQDQRARLVRAAERDGSCDLSGQPVSGLHLGAGLGPELLVSAQQSRADQRDLVREEPVEPGPGDPRVFGDLPHGRTPDPGAAKAAFGGVEQPVARA